MFTEMTIQEQQGINGGWLPAVPVVVKAVVAVAGAVKGCTNEAAKDR